MIKNSLINLKYIEELNTLNYNIKFLFKHITHKILYFITPKERL